MEAKELLERYAAGERDFNKLTLSRANLQGAVLEGANLEGANLMMADLASASLERANLSRTCMLLADLREANVSAADLTAAHLANARLRRANLERANLERANLKEANLESAYMLLADLRSANLSAADLQKADLTVADLTAANLERACLLGANLSGAKLSGAKLKMANCAQVQLGSTVLADIDLAAFSSARVKHLGCSTVDYRSVIRSVHAPGLRDFLRAAGMPEVFVDHMLTAALAAGPNAMLSTLISHGGPDEPFARALNQRLRANGVTTFFYPLDAKLGHRNASVMHRGVREHDRIVVVCSEASLTRPGVLTKLTEAMTEEARRGGQDCLIPITLDGYVFSEAFQPKNPDLKDLLVQRVIGDFRGADKDEGKLAVALPRLIEALRRPVEIREG